MNILTKKTILLSISILYLFVLKAQVITVGSTGDYPTLSAAASNISAGDTVKLQSQIFSNGSQFLSDLVGTAADPIVIIAETEHGAIFRGGSQAIHLSSCEYVELNGLVIEQQTSNGINIDDGGNLTDPTEHITIRNCIFRDMPSSGNNDLLKMSGVDNFLIENCQFTDGSGGGSGIDFVGCHFGVVQDCSFDNTGQTGIQNKGGSQHITIQRNVLKNMSQRALNLGGSTDHQFFRPPLPDPIVDAFEAADINVFSNVFIGSRAPIAYVGCVRVKVFNNTFFKPDNWVIRILQETTDPGFLPCSNNEFGNNIVYQETDLTEVNIGSNTLPNTFIFSNNLWFNESNNSWSPNLPVADPNQVIANPSFENSANENFNLISGSPAIGVGNALNNPTTDFANQSFNNPPSIGAFEGNVLLAIESLDPFRATLQGKAVELSWSTILEYNNKGFEIQRSKDGEAWTNIAWVDGHDYSDRTIYYRYLDQTPLKGNNFYRFKQIDFDGTTSYSKIAHVFLKHNKVFVYPNPASNYMIINGMSTRDARYVIIYDIAGKLVKTGPFEEQIDISSLRSGIYQVHIQGRYETVKLPLVINK